MAASGNLNGNANVVIGNANWSTQIQGVGAEIEQVREWSVAKGRYFDAREAASGAKVAVLGDTVANELFGAGDPVGATVRINNAPFQVIGVLSKKGQAGGRDQDDVVMVPISTARSRLVGRLGAPDQIGSLLVKVDPRYNISEVQSDIERVLRERRRIGADKENNFIIRNFAEFLETRNQAAQTLGLLLAATAAISLVVGGIGIMNIMLVSVTERTREIGLRMAIGARGSDILGQFLTEAVLLCLVGGLIGLTLGAGVSYHRGQAAGLAHVHQSGDRAGGDRRLGIGGRHLRLRAGAPCLAAESHRRPALRVAPWRGSSRQVHLPQRLLVARIGLEGIEFRSHLDVEQARVTHCERALQPLEGVLAIRLPRVDHRDLRAEDIGCLVDQPLQRCARIRHAARRSRRPSPARSRGSAHRSPVAPGASPRRRCPRRSPAARDSAIHRWSRSQFFRAQHRLARIGKITRAPCRFHPVPTRPRRRAGFAPPSAAARPVLLPCAR